MTLVTYNIRGLVAWPDAIPARGVTPISVPVVTIGQVGERLAEQPEHLRGIVQTISRSAGSLVQSRWAHEMRHSP